MYAHIVIGSFHLASMQTVVLEFPTKMKIASEIFAR